MHDLIHEFVHTLFHLDGKFFTTLKHIFIPAKLTLEFFKGHHKRYAHPVQLFLVVGAAAFAVLVSKFSKFEQKTKHDIETKKANLNRNKFLHELDSTSRALMPEAKGNEIENIRDSLIFKMKYPQGNETNEEDVRKKLDAIFDKLVKKRGIVHVENSNDITAFKVFKDSMIQVLMTENLDSLKQIKRNETDSIGKAPANEEFIAGFKKGWNKGWNEGGMSTLKDKLRPEIQILKAKNGNIKEAIKIDEDSTNLFSLNFFNDSTKKSKQLNIPTAEIYELTPDSIIAKYKITEFQQKVQIKQFLKAQTQTNDLVHFILNKLFLMTFALIPVLALFQLLLYRRQKRFYVEHFVFLLHANTTLFVGLALAMMGTEYWYLSVNLFLILAVIFFFLSLKFYYKQGWGKTLLKFFLILFFYLIFALVFFTITSIIGFLLF